jgi:hypothetical protein
MEIRREAPVQVLIKIAVETLLKVSEQYPRVKYE